MTPGAASVEKPAAASRRRSVLHLANAVLAIGGVLGLVAFTFYCFRSAPSGDGLITPAPTLGSYAAFFTVPAVLFASLLLRPSRRIAMAALCVAAVASVYATEIVLDVTGWGAAAAPFWSMSEASSRSKRTFEQLTREYGVQADLRSRLDVLDEIRARHVDAAPAIMLADVLLGEDGLSQASESGASGELLPLGGISSTTTVLCNELGSYVIYRSDEHGFRNPPGVWSLPRADVAAVGQSLAQGYCVPDGASFVDLLRPRYPATLNLGVSGESAMLQLAAIKEYLLPRQPRAVLWFYYEGQDLRTLYEESTHPLVMRYLEPTFTQRLVSRQPEIDAALRRFVADKEKRQRLARPETHTEPLSQRVAAIAKLWHIREHLEQVYGIRTEDAYAWAQLQELAQNLLGDALVQSNTLTRSWGGTLYFVYLPSWNRYRNGSSAAEYDRKRVISLVNTLGIPVIDIHAEFAAQPDPLSLFPYRRFGHYNEAGNRVVADALLRALDAQRAAQR